jgi:cold shock CspA family protein
MDEYRPYPAEQPEETAEHETTYVPEEAGAAPPADEAEGEAGAGDMSDRTHPERQAPDLEHPGGHLHGSVARMNRPRRFGFLRSDDGVEVFFHASALEAGPNAFDALRPGQEMEWDCHQDEQGRGLAATTVTILGEPPERPARPPRPERAERPERQERQQERHERGGRQRSGQQTGWRVTIITERGDQTVAAQLERLLNDRGVKPGNFTFNLTETDEGVECWVATFSGS